MEGFTDLALSATEFWQAENDVLRLHVLKPGKVDMTKPLVSLVDVQLDLFALWRT